MKIRCPRCHTIARLEDVNLAKLSGHCRACDASFAFDEAALADDTPETSARRPLPRHAERRAELADNITAETETVQLAGELSPYRAIETVARTERTTIVRRWSDKMGILFGFLAILWLGFCALVARPPDRIAGLPIVLGLAVLVYSLATRFVNRTVIEADREGLVVTSGPLPSLAWNRRLLLSSVAAIDRYETIFSLPLRGARARPRRGWYRPPIYVVYADLKSGERVKLVHGLDVEESWSIVEQLQSHLTETRR